MGLFRHSMSTDMKTEFLDAYDRYASALYRHCYFRVFSSPVAEDMVQDVFCKTWQYLANGGTIGNIRAFLYRVANNLIIDRSRKKKEESLDMLLENGVIPEPSDSGFHDISQAVELREIREALDRLPEDQREILTLRYIDDLDPREIALILNITSNNASVRLNRAIKALRDLCDHGRE